MAISIITKIPIFFSYTYFILAFLIIILGLYEYFLNKKIDYLAIFFLLIHIVFIIIQSVLKPYCFYLLFGIELVFVIVGNVWFIYTIVWTNTIKQKILEQVKNDTSDYYFCLNQNNQIVDYGYNFGVTCNLTKRQMMSKKGLVMTFKAFNVTSINGKEYSIDTLNDFKNSLLEASSKFKMYEFILEVKSEKNENRKSYKGFAQPIYLGNKRIATAIYLYFNKVDIVEELRKKVTTSLKRLKDYKNVSQILLSLSEGVALYYDYQENLFFATQQFLNYTLSNKKTYTFKEFYDLIVDEDKEHYNMQTETVNSINVTRIKFRMKIKDVVFNAIEDSLFLTKEGQEYISIIHITSLDNENINDNILSTKEAVDLMSNLSETPVTPIVYKTEEILTKALKKN